MSDSQDQTTSTLDLGTSLSVNLPRSLRGYDRAATDALFEEAASKQKELERECTALREQVAQLEDDLARHRAQEHVVARALLEATSHATAIRDSARREAEVLLAKAREELDRRTERAERLERDRAQAENQLLRMRRLAQEMQSGLSGFLTRALEQLRPQEGTPQTLRASADDAVVGMLEGRLKHGVSEQPSQGDGVGSVRPSS